MIYTIYYTGVPFIQVTLDASRIQRRRNRWFLMHSLIRYSTGANRDSGFLRGGYDILL
jgi:hypothetical protein